MSKVYVTRLFLIILILENFNIFSQCLQVYPWASWNSFKGNNTIGEMKVAGKKINVEISANYLFSSTKRTYNYSQFSTLNSTYKINNLVVPQIPWADNNQGKTSICFSEPVLNPIILMASLGSETTPVTLNFEQEYLTLFAGENVTFLDKKTLVGKEGLTMIVFPGVHNCINITSSNTENYTYLNVGLLTPSFPIDIVELSSRCGNKTMSATAFGGNYYLWSGGERVNSSTNTFLESGIYAITVTDVNGCSSVGIKKIDVMPKTTVYSTIKKKICKGETFFTYSSSGIYVDTLKTTLGCDSVRILNLEVVDLKISGFDNLREICSGKKIVLRPIINLSNLPVKYNWSTGDTVSNITISKSGAYVLYVTNGICIYKDSITIVDGQIPKLKGSDTLCFSNAPIILDSEVSEDDYTFHWTPSNLTTSQISVQKSGNYQVTVTSSAGCESTREFIVVNPVSIELGEDKYLCEGDSIKLTPLISGLGGNKYQWSNGQTLRNIIVTQAGKYKFTVLQKFCSVSDSINVFYKNCVKIFAPNAFSPNGDGINDFFSISTFNIKISSLQIFDRWGNIVYFEESQSPKWDGKYLEIICPLGTYRYVLTFYTPFDASIKTYQGALSLFY